MIKKVTIIRGVIGENKEVDYFKIMIPREYKITKDLKIKSDSNCYFRCEVELDSINKKRVFAMSNPIWLSPNIN